MKEYKIVTDETLLHQTDESEVSWDYNITDDNDFVLCCDGKDIVINGEKVNLGSPTGIKDKHGNMIFTKHSLLDIYSSDPTAIVSVMIIADEIDYGLSNYHCGHCPMYSGSVIINGVTLNDTDTLILVRSE